MQYELIDIHAVYVITALVVFLLACAYDYFDGGNGGSGWGIYTDEEHIKRLNETIKHKKEILLI